MIRDAEPEDWPAMWPVMRPIIAAGETFPYDPDMSEDEARSAWLAGSPGRAAVAVADEGTVMGTSTMGRNRGGPGSHVATASFMVASDRAGAGVGRALVEDALAWARAQGFRGLQFNAVAATNVRAVRLYESLGFEILGTVPDGFRHPAEGFVGLHVMYCRL